MATRIRADVLIPGRGDPVDDGTVIVDGATITFAGSSAEAPPPDGDDAVVEVPVVLPGLWDCHSHFVGLAITDLGLLASVDPLAAAAATVPDLAAVLDGGVTSVRDTGGMGLTLAALVDAGRIVGPWIHGAGRILSMTGGHGDIHSVPLHVADCLTCNHEFSILCDGVPEVLKAVRTNLRKDARLIKVCASGGVMSEVDHPKHQQFSDEELAAIVGEARRAQRIVAAHCHGKDGIMAALRAGCHTIEHGSFLDEEAADLMLETGAMLVATRFVVENLLARLDLLPDYVAEKGRMVSDAHMASMELAVSKGIPMAMGCDIFTSGTGYGRNSEEIRYLIAAGMSDLEAIEAATANGPATLGPQAPRSGMLAVGYDADLIALDTNPLDDRSVWGDPDRVTHVWQGGQVRKGPPT